MRRMNYNPFEKPFASGELSGSQSEGLYFILDNPIEEGIYFFEIVEADIETNDVYTSTGIIKFHESTDNNILGQSSQFFGLSYRYLIYYLGDLKSTDDDHKKLSVEMLDGYQVDTSLFSYTIHLYKIV